MKLFHNFWLVNGESAVVVDWAEQAPETYLN